MSTPETKITISPVSAFIRNEPNGQVFGGIYVEGRGVITRLRISPGETLYDFHQRVIQICVAVMELYHLSNQN